MPGIGGITVTPGNMILGPANIFVGVTNPATGTQITLTSGLPSSGTNIGATVGPVEFNYRPSVAEFKVEQALSPVDFAVTEEEATLSFEVGETVGLTLEKLFQGLTMAGAGATQWAYAGGKMQPSSQSILMVHPRRDDSKYAYILLYKAFLSEPITMSFSRAAVTSWRVRMKGLADVTRAVNDQLFHIVPRTA